MNAHELATEIWSAAQLTPGEGIEDGIARIEEILDGPPLTQAVPPTPSEDYQPPSVYHATDRDRALPG